LSYQGTKNHRIKKYEIKQTEFAVVPTRETLR